jgi:hypothetical protein
VSAIERACEIAASHQAYHLRTIRTLIGRNAAKQETLEFMSEHDMIRPLVEYDRFVHKAFKRKETSP